MSVNDKYTRRALLGRLGGAAAVGALTPFVPYTEAEAAAAAKPRYVYWFTPVNPKSALVDPTLPNTSGDITDLQWRGRFTALNEMKDKMSLYGGLTNMARKDGDLGGGHRDSWVSMLVGAASKKRGSVPAGSTNLGGGASIGRFSSIDQYLANELPKKGVNTPIKDIRFGWEYAKDGLNSVSFYNGAEQLRESQPSRVFDRMFQFAGQGGGGGTDLTYKKNVLDYVYGDIQRVKTKLGADDRIRVDKHLNAIDEVQRVIEASSQTGGDTCSIPEALDIQASNMDQAVSAFSKLTAIAFNCDLTRVAGGQFLPYQAGDAYHEVPDLRTLGNKVNATWHSATHDKGGSQADIYAFIRGVQEYRCKIYLNLLKELDGFEEPTGGTLLDSSIVHWYVEVSKDHKVSDQFNLIAGGAGHFQMGKRFIVGGRTGDNGNATQNMLLTSIANAMGFDIPNVGEAKYHNGPIPSKYLA